MKAYELLKEYGWCQGSFARKADGTKCDWQDEGAVYFCLVGAMYRCYINNPDSNAALMRLWKEFGHSCTAFEFNDDPQTTKEDVLALLEKVDI